MKDFSPQTWFVRIVTNMRSALHSSAGEISKNSTTLMWQKKGVGEHVQLGPFHNPSYSFGLTACLDPRLYHLCLHYPLLLCCHPCQGQNTSKKSNPENLPLGKRKSNKPSEIDMNPLYLVVDFLPFGLFIMTYLFVYLL